MITRNLSLLSTGKVPGLRKLELKIYSRIVRANGAEFLARICTNFPCLEGLYFHDAAFIPDVVFLGANGELPFLQLTSKKGYLDSMYNIYFEGQFFWCYKNVSRFLCRIEGT